MKKFLLANIFAFIFIAAIAQNVPAVESDNKFFKQENFFAGGNVSILFFNNATFLGINPYFGYNITKWLDAAVSMNVNYISQRNYFIDNDKIRQTIYAPGTLLRIYPVKFLYAEGQFEHHFIHQKYIPPSNSGNFNQQFNYQVNTLLVGLGYASEREYDDDEFYFFSVSIDALLLPGSPYTNGNQHPYPIIKAGYNVKLFQGHKRRR